MFYYPFIILPDAVVQLLLCDGLGSFDDRLKVQFKGSLKFWHESNLSTYSIIIIIIC